MASIAVALPLPSRATPPTSRLPFVSPWTLLQVAQRFGDRRDVLVCALLCLKGAPTAAAEVSFPGALSWVAAAAKRGDAVSVAYLAQARNCGGRGVAKDRPYGAALVSSALGCSSLAHAHSRTNSTADSRRDTAATAAGAATAAIEGKDGGAAGHGRVVAPLQALADAGDAEAQYRLAMCLERRVIASARVDDEPLPPQFAYGGRSKRGAERDDGSTAAQLYARAAASGAVGTLVPLAMMHFKGAPGVKRDPVLGERLLRRDADAGCAAAMVLVGDYVRSLGASKSELARSWYERATVAGDAMGHVRLGEMHEADGDPFAAMEQYARAVTACDAVDDPSLYVTARAACGHVANLYANGAADFPASAEAAIEWAERADLPIPAAARAARDGAGGAASGAAGAAAGPRDDGDCADAAAERLLPQRSVADIIALHESNSGAALADVAATGGYLNLLKSNVRAADIPGIVDVVATNTSITRLGLSHNPRVGADGAAALMRGLTVDNKCPWLRELFMRECNVGDAGAAALAVALGNMPSLVKLGLDRNDIGDDGIVALCHALQGSGAVGGTRAAAESGGGGCRIAVIGLTANRFGDEGAQAVARVLCNPACGVMRIYLNDNRISDVGCEALAAALRLNSRLQRLGISDNRVTDGGGHALLASLRSPIGSRVEKLCCSGNRFSDLVHDQLHKLPNVFIGPRSRRHRGKIADGSKCLVMIVWTPPEASAAAAMSVAGASGGLAGAGGGGAAVMAGATA